MKILLDECIPAKLRTHLRIHEVITATWRGWAGIKNGKLLALAATEFDVFVTVDKNLSFQQNIEMLPIPVIVLHAHSNELKFLLPLMPQLQRLVETNLEKKLFHIRPA